MFKVEISLGESARFPTTPAKTLPHCQPQEIPNISENESFGKQLFQACAIDADGAVNWMGRIRLFPLLFQNGSWFSQSSHFSTAGQEERGGCFFFNSEEIIDGFEASGSGRWKSSFRLQSSSTFSNDKRKKFAILTLRTPDLT